MKLQDTIIVRRDSPFLVRFEKSLKQALIDRSEKEGMPIAALIRIAVRAFLEMDQWAAVPRKKR